jgi:beta-glucosidase
MENGMTDLTLTRRALLASSMLTLVPSLAFATETAVYRDPKAPIEARVRDLLRRMTIEEKAAQLRCAWFGKGGFLDAAGNFAPDKAAKFIAHGIGQIARPGDWAGTAKYPQLQFRDAGSMIALINAVQRYHLEQTRLGIPALFHEEAAHGFVGSEATIFPSPPALGSTWDPELVEKVFAVTAREARAHGATVVLAPVLDLARDPRYGRVEEFFGEDAYLVGKMGVAAVRGFQGPTRPLGKDRVFATLKHFIHGSPQGGLNIAPADISERTLRGTYLVPFARVIAEVDPAIIMPSYNEVAGVPAHANFELLMKTGRQRLGFKGAYFSDYGGVTNLVEHHHMVANNDDAAELAMLSGVDAELPDGQAYAALPKLVEAGRIPMSRIDDSVSHVLRLKFEAGLFENPYVDAAAASRATGRPAHVALARTAAAKSIVLLKNDGIAPLDKRRPLRIAVIGPNAKEPLFGGYSGTQAKAVGILDGIRAAAGRSSTISYAEGVRLLKDEPRNLAFVVEEGSANEPRIAEAVATAIAADVVVLVVGDRPAVTREAVQYDAPGDRRTLDLFGDQGRLVEAIAATDKPIVTLLLSGRPLAVPRLSEVSRAMYEGWYLGQEGGHAFADVLFGAVNPGGKLTMTFPREVGDLPVYYDRHPSADMNKYVEGKPTPLFPFGHGLSYTTFDIAAPRIATAEIGRSERFAVDVDVINTGTRAGDEVVQIYIRDEVSSVPRPMLELKAFRRISLAPGEKRTVRFDLGPDDLAFWNIDMKWAVEPGMFTISAGGSSAALKPAKLKVV